MSASSYPEMVALVYWWDHEALRWTEVSWDKWAAATGIRAPARPLTGIRPGDTYFAVCVIDDDGSIANIIPHRYIIDAEGYRQRGNEPITNEEREIESAHYIKRETTEAEDRRHVEINEKIYRWSLPPTDAALRLLKTLPAPPSVDAQHGVRHFMMACGVSRGSDRLQ